jgi:acyl-CoA thioesterase-1
MGEAFAALRMQIFRRRYGPLAVVFKAAAILLVLASPVAAKERLRIVALGDSLTAGYGLPPAEAFPAQLEARLKALGVDAEIVNAGVSGDTTAGGLARLDWALADRADYVLVELGANDALRGLDPGEAKANLEKIIAGIEAKGAKPILLGMLALGNWGRDYETRFNDIYPALAAEHHLPLYPFFLEGVVQDPALNQADGLHPNAKGVARIVERVAPFVQRCVEAGA